MKEDPVCQEDIYRTEDIDHKIWGTLPIIVRVMY